MWPTLFIGFIWVKGKCFNWKKCSFFQPDDWIFLSPIDPPKGELVLAVQNDCIKPNVFSVAHRSSLPVTLSTAKTNMSNQILLGISACDPSIFWMVELFQLRQNDHFFVVHRSSKFIWGYSVICGWIFFLPTAQWPILLDEILKAALVENWEVEKQVRMAASPWKFLGSKLGTIPYL